MPFQQKVEFQQLICHESVSCAGSLTTKNTDRSSLVVIVRYTMNLYPQIL
jgi:hypothetical protein